MRVIMSLLSVVALMLVMLATSVAPALATAPFYRCELRGELHVSILATSQELDFYKSNYGATCIRIDPVPG